MIYIGLFIALGLLCLFCFGFGERLPPPSPPPEPFIPPPTATKAPVLQSWNEGWVEDDLKQQRGYRRAA